MSAHVRLQHRSTARRAASGATLVLLLAGCATATRVPVAPAHRGRIQSTQAVAALTQQELGMHIEVSTAGGGFGLIGAIIDSSVNNSRAKDAEAMVTPVRDTLVGYDVGATLAGALQKELAPLAWLKAGPVEVRQFGAPKDVEEWLKKSPADALLVVRADYRLTPGGDAMVIRGDVALRSHKLFPMPASAEDAERPPLFLNAVHVYLPLPGRPAGELPAGEVVKLWAADGGRPARQALDSGLAELARLVAYDLEQSGPAGTTYDPPAGARPIPVAVPGVAALEGFVAVEQGGRKWVRVPTGDLCSVP